MICPSECAYHDSHFYELVWLKAIFNRQRPPRITVPWRFLSQSVKCTSPKQIRKVQAGLWLRRTTGPIRQSSQWPRQSRRRLPHTAECREAADQRLERRPHADQRQSSHSGSLGENQAEYVLGHSQRTTALAIVAFWTHSRRSPGHA
jgi:hypothetical protein